MIKDSAKDFGQTYSTAKLKPSKQKTCQVLFYQGFEMIGKNDQKGINIDAKTEVSTTSIKRVLIFMFAIKNSRIQLQSITINDVETIAL